MMNNKKLLFLAIFLVLAKSALGIEVEPNNDSSKANQLGFENVGQLSSGGDVDFFSITNSCIKYTLEDEKSDTSGRTKAGDCAKYTDDNLNATPPHKKGDIKYRTEISLTFSCNSRASIGKGGWYLGIFDSNGILQNTYQVQPNDCMVGSTNSKGPYEFKFSTLTTDNILKPNAKYYVSVTGDCHLPIYNLSDSNIISINPFSTPATTADIQAAKDAIDSLNTAIITAKSATGNGETSINVDAYVTTITSIYNKSVANQTAASTIKKITSTANTIRVLVNAVTTARIEDVNTAIGILNLAVTDNIAIVNVAADDCNSIGNTATYTIKDNTINTPYLESEILKNPTTLIQDAENIGQIKTENSFKFYSIDVITADAQLEFSCHKNAAASVGVDTSGWVISIWSMGSDGKLNSEVEANYEIAPQDCTPNEADTSTYTYTTTTAAGTTVNTSTSTSTTPVYSWTPTGPYKITIPKNSSCNKEKICTYYVGVQTNCLTNPENTTSIPVWKSQITGYTNLDCAVNTSSFSIKVKNESNESIDDLIKSIKSDEKDKFENHNLGSSKTSHVSTLIETKLYYVDSGNPKNEIPLTFFCSKATTRFSNNWKLNIYNGAKVLQSSQFINGSDCGTEKQGDNGPLKFNLPNGSSRYYLTLKSACVTDDKNCVVETSDFTISRDKLTLAGVAVSSPYRNISSSSKLTPLELKKKGQITSVKDFRFYSIDREITDDLALSFECQKNSDSNSNGWVVSVWNHDKSNKTADTIQNVYSISSSKCSTTDSTTKQVVPFQIPLPPISSADKSYYIGVQTSCLAPIPLDADSSYTPLIIPEPGYTYIPCTVNTDTFTLTLPENAQKLDSESLSTSNNLGNDKTGQINSMTDNDVYTIENNGTTDIPLIFSCSPMAMRQTNDWKLSIYNSTNELVSSEFVNGSDCGSGFIGDKGGYSINLPKGSPFYYLSVKSACPSLSKKDKDCVVDTAEYNISRNATKVYTGKLASKTLTATSVNLKLTNCGLNSGSIITINGSDLDLNNVITNKTLPIKIQIGSMACQILTLNKSTPTTNAILGNITSPSMITDSNLIAKDSAIITLTDCGSSNAKIILTGSRLDLEDLNPSNATRAVVIPIKISIGDFKCEAKDSFYLTNGLDSIYDIASRLEATSDTSTSSTTTPLITKTTDSFDSTWLATKTNLGATVQTGQISNVTDTKIYQIDTGTEDANLTFSCGNSRPFQNDWKILIYDSTKNLKSTTIINGSSCATTTGYALSLTKESPTYYLVVKSACDVDDKTCAVDKSQYQLKRITATQAATNATATKPCFGTNCTTTTTVKPFFK